MTRALSFCATLAAMTKAITILAALALAGCGSKKSGGDSAKCADAIGKSVDQMMAAMPNADKVPEDMKANMKERGEQLKKVLTTRCTEDNWPSDVIDCYSKAASMPDIRACREKLPPELSQKAQDEVRKVMMGMGGDRPHHRRNGDEGSGGGEMAGSGSAAPGSAEAPGSAAPAGSAAAPAGGAAAGSGSGK